jgi:hypothetical protein
MLRRFGKKTVPDTGAQSSRSAALEAIDALYKQEMQTNIAALRERRRQARLERSVAHWTEYWPVAVGVVMSFFAPQVRDMLAPLQQWGMWLVFPFVALAQRPEIYMGDKMAVLLPMVMLYAQFPLEGWLAKIMLKGNVTVRAVIGRVMFFHALCILELWLVSGAFWRLLAR